MIEFYKDISLPISEEQFETLASTITAGLSPPWSIPVRKFEARLPGLPTYVFAYLGADAPPATVTLAYLEGAAIVANVVPVAIGQLTRAEYNAVFDLFCADCLLPAARALNFQWSETAERRDIGDWLSEQAKRKLTVFSDFANKGSGSAHPSDNARWLDFIVQSHKEHSALGAEVLRRWLIEELSWPETIAVQLASEYENARELLTHYDKNR